MSARSTSLGFLTLLLACGWTAAARAERFTIDPGHSTVLFRIMHMNTSYAWGRFDRIAGVIDLDEKNPAQNAFDITIDAESVDTGLVKRDEHLRGPDFFSAREFPEITFKSDSVRAKPDGIYEVVGKLKLHGVTKPLTVSLKKVGTGKNPMGMQIIGVDTGFTVKRTDFNMKNLLEGVGDEVLLIVSLEAGRK